MSGLETNLKNTRPRPHHLKTETETETISKRPRPRLQKIGLETFITDSKDEEKKFNNSVNLLKSK